MQIQELPGKIECNISAFSCNLFRKRLFTGVGEGERLFVDFADKERISISPKPLDG